MIQSLVNGKPQHQVSILDRGLQFGDGVFETLAVVNHRPCLWQYHMQRLQLGCERLGIPCPEESLLLSESRQLLESTAQAVLKIIVTRGESKRGYKAASSTTPTRIISVNSWRKPDPSPVTVAVSQQRLGDNPYLAGIKHLNRLEQVMARQACPEEAYDALMLDQQNHLIEGIMHNVFIQKSQQLYTPILDHCGVAGVLRRTIMERAEALSMPVLESRLGMNDVLQGDALYLCNSLSGIRAVSAIIGHDWQPSKSRHPVIDQLTAEIFDKC